MPRGGGGSVVREILSKIDWFCNQKRWRRGGGSRGQPRQASRDSGRMRLKSKPTRAMPTFGTMMGFPLTLPPMLERAGKLYPRVEIVSRRPDCSVIRSNYGELYRRAR